MVSFSVMSFVESLNKLLGDPAEKELKKLEPQVPKVGKALQAMQTLQKGDLPGKTEEFKQRIQQVETLDALLSETFALAVRACELLVGTEVSLGKRTEVWNMVPFDVQLLGGIVLHKGNIAEMKTGEGKTLVCTLPAYLNALAGKGVHVVTVNDYLANRDAQWMGRLYNFLGLTVGINLPNMPREQKQ